MAEQIVKQSLAAPGFLGLNNQDSNEESDIRFARVAENVVFDSAGRLASRKGWTPITAELGIFSEAGASEYGIAEYGIAEYGAPTNMKFIFEFSKEDSNIIISGGGGQLYTGTTNITNETIKNADNTGVASYTITADNWQAVALPFGEKQDSKPHAYLVQANHRVLMYHELPSGGGGGHVHDSGTYGFQVLDDIGTLPSGYSAGEFKPNCGLAAYGRIWLANSLGDPQTIYFSRLLDGSDFSGGDAGSLSLNAVFPNSDEIVALAAHNGFLIVFGRDNIAVFANASDVTELTLVDYIPNVGCIARDSVQGTGTDLIFLSRTGLLSLQRVIQEKSLPFRDLSKNIRDEFLVDVLFEAESNIKGIYYPKDAFYLLSLSGSNKTYCFDTRALLPNNAARVTTWTDFSPNALCVTEDDKLLIATPSYLGEYTGYFDNGDTYRLRYYTNYTNLNAPANLKLLKKLGFTFRGQSNKQFYIYWGFDYTENYKSTVKSVAGGDVFEYGLGEYGIAEYGDGSFRNGSFIVNSSGTGNVVQVGVEADIDGNYLAIQKIDIFAKQGKVI